MSYAAGEYKQNSDVLDCTVLAHDELTNAMKTGLLGFYCRQRTCQLSDIKSQGCSRRSATFGHHSMR
eukprot:4046499-Amphidinium_carterae.1